MFLLNAIEELKYYTPDKILAYVLSEIIIGTEPEAL